MMQRTPLQIRILFFLMSCCLWVFILSASNTSGQAAPQFSATDLINGVNALRAANGLPPYSINPILMSIAQVHSDYQAAIGTVTHTGANGSSPRDRAIAAGYGGGATVFISENIMGGSNLTAAQAIEAWQGDATHLNTMLGTSYLDAGAGVAYSGNRAYFTLDVGWISGSPGTSSTIPTAAASTSGSSSMGAAPAQQATEGTPSEDGSIIHIVGQGETLWTISVIYGIPLNDLLALNGMNQNSMIFVGDEIIIRAPEITETPTPTATHTPTATPTRTPRPTATLRPTQIPTAVIAALPSATPEPTEIPIVTYLRSPKNQIQAALVGLAVLAGLLVVLGGLGDRRRAARANLEPGTETSAPPHERDELAPAPDIEEARGQAVDLDGDDNGREGDIPDQAEPSEMEGDGLGDGAQSDVEAKELEGDGMDGASELEEGNGTGQEDGSEPEEEEKPGDHSPAE